MKSSKKRTTLPIYPFLFALATVASLLATNKAEIMPIAAVRLAVVMLVVTLIGYLILLAIFRNKHKAALVTTVLLVLFVSYGSLYNILHDTKALNLLAHHSYLALLYLAILATAVLLIIRMKKPQSWTWALNVIMGIALIIPIARTVIYYSANSMPTEYQASQEIVDNPTYTLSSDTKPDIYYIIVDSYTRQDALYNDYGFDNSAFIQELRDRGFYVGDCSRSNYAHTRLSLSSSMNLNYLPDLGIKLTADSDDMSKLGNLILHSSVRRHLAEIGYKSVAFETGYIFTDMTDADIYYKSPNNTIFSKYIEPFEYLYLQDSAFLFVIDTQTDFMDHFMKPLVFPFTGQKVRVENIFTELPTVAEIDGPKFVFVHVEIPHHPFIFMPDGSINPDQRYYPNVYMPELDLEKKGYINQVQYVNNQILPIVDQILANSKTPPIIIIQGDHGLEAGERNLILDAIYLPDGGQQDLYSHISPVNTFRVVFNNYFGTDLPLLDDKSFYSDYEDKMSVSPVDDPFSACAVQ
jgi:hypothetical protein